MDIVDEDITIVIQPPDEFSVSVQSPEVSSVIVSTTVSETNIITSPDDPPVDVTGIPEGTVFLKYEQ
jgi:hypothetical protein